MKAAESKTTTTAQSLQAKGEAQQPFFQPQEDRTGAFFGNEQPAVKPFFTPFIQTKLTIGQPGDQYEQEADAMAEQVVQRMAVGGQLAGGSSAVGSGPRVQRKCAACAAEKQEEGIAPKLQLKSIFESNEDPVGGQVQRKCEACAAEQIQPMRIQRMGEEEEPELQAKGAVPGLQASAYLESRLNATKGSGSPLPDETRSSMESSFGTDFSGVRVHTNSGAVQMNQELGAQAFTHGSDVYFGAGKYDPGSTAGNRLLGHELTHVMQQGGGNLVTQVQLQGEEEFKVYPVKVPRGLNSEAELDRYAEIMIFGQEVNRNWTIIGIDVKASAGKTINYKFHGFFVTQHGGKDTAAAPAPANPDYNALNKEQKTSINKEIDRRYYQNTKTPEGEKIKKGEQAKIHLWNVYRDQVVAERKKLEDLPEGLKSFLFKSGAPPLEPKDYPKVLEIVSKIKDLTLAELNEYKSRITAETTDWGAYEASLGHFLAERKERRATAKEKDVLETKFFGLDALYDRYREYLSLLANNAKLSGMGMVNPRAGGAAMGAQPTINKMRAELDADLIKAGFAGGISEFEKFIKDYENVFERETLSLATVMLDQYEHQLFIEEKRYQNPGEIKILHDAVRQSKAASDYAEAEQIRSEHATMIVMTPDEMAEQAYWVGQRNEALSRGKEKVRTAALNHSLIQKQDFPHESLANASSENEARSVIFGYIAARKHDISETRKNLIDKPKMMYGLDKLLEASFKAQKIQPGTIYDKIIRNHIKDVNWSEAIPKIIGAVIAIAVGLLTFGGGTVAAIAAAASFGLSAYQVYEEFKEYEMKNAAAGSVLLSDDPSLVWVIIAIAGAGIDLATIASTIKAIKPVVKTLEVTGDVTKFDESLKAMAKAGQLEEKIAKRILEANKARNSANKAAEGFFKAINGKAYSIPGPFADPEVYSHLVKFASYKIKEGVEDFLIFVERVKLARVEAKLGEMTPEELLKVKKAWDEAKQLKEFSETLIGKATAKADELIRTLSNSQRGPVLSTVLDTKTGKPFFGINKPTAIDDLHPILRKRLDALNAKTGGKGLRPEYTGEIPGSHSEIDAMNQALKAREAAGIPVTEANLGEFLIHNRALRGSGKNIGIPPRCLDCTNLTDGVTMIE